MQFVVLLSTSPVDKGNTFFIMRNLLLKFILATMAAAALLQAGNSHAAPAAKTGFFLYQPDGTAVKAMLKGDEYMKILTTADGYTIKQGEDKWYYYAFYEDDGSLTMSGYKAGQDAPADIKARSRNIPYAALAEAAAEKRALRSPEDPEKESLLARTKAARGLATRSSGTVTEKHGIVILAQFQDLSFQEGHTRDAFVRMLTQEGYSRNGATGSAIDYFNEQFSGQFTFSFDVSEIVTLPNNCAYYGGNDSHNDDSAPAEMIEDACRLADSQIDFSKYDDDGDGEVDNVFVFFAGGDEAEGAGDDRIWSHAWYLWDGARISLTLDGKRINRYACTAELHRSGYNSYVLAGIGTFCHEFSHTLGLMDYYDTDYEQSGGQSDAMWGSTALMDSGNQNNDGNTPPNLNAVDHDALGISEPVILSAGTHTLTPIDVDGTYYRMDTDKENEYFLFECRRTEGWDRYIGGSGLLIYHIDKSDNNAGYSGTSGNNISAQRRWANNEINCNPAHQCADLIEAYPNAGSVSQVFFPYVTSSASYDSFTPNTTPAFTFWSGESSSLAITGIEKAGDNIVITVSESGSAPEPVNVTNNIFQDAVIINWDASDAEYDGKGYVKWTSSSSGEEGQTIEVEPYADGRYAAVIEGLVPRIPYKAEIYFLEGGVKSEVYYSNFTTKSPKDYNYPFIYLYNVEKNRNGTYPSGTKFPLRLYNAYDAEHIEWFYNGTSVTVAGDGYFTPKNSGEMKAVIYYPDGSKSIVSRKITIE